MRYFLFILFFTGSLYFCNGQIWKSVTPYPELFPDNAEVPDTNHLRGLSGKEIRYSDDGGANWNAINTGRQLSSIQFTSAQHGWFSADSGRIFRTSDGCATWDTVL